MKRTRAMVATLAIIFGLGSVVQAKLPPNSIMVGGNVYSAGYLSDQNNLARVNDQLMNNLGSIYFIDSSKKAKDVFTGAAVEDRELSAKFGNTLTYYNPYGVKQKIVTDANGEFTDPTNVNTNMFAIVNVTYKPLTIGLNLYTVKITQIEGISNATYFKAGDSAITPITDMTTFIGGASGAGSLISIFASDGITELANGYMNIKQNSNDSGSQNVSVILTETTSQDPTYKTMHGNTAVNITNNGLASIDKTNRWIYYKNTADKDKLYRKSVTGVEDYVISDDKVGFINVVGDWVYYVNYTDNARIYKVRTDGTQKQKIVDDMASCLNVVGDKVYYINNSDRARIYICDSEGKRQLISDSAKHLSVGDNFLFYVNTSDGNKLYNYSLLNNRKTKLSDINTEFISAAGDYLIFYTGKDGILYRSTGSYTKNPPPMPLITNVPKKGGKGGTTEVTPIVDTATVICGIDDNNIYYKSRVDGEKVYKLDSTGNGFKVVDAAADYMNIVGDYLYFVKGTKGSYVHKDSDGSEKGTSITKPKLDVKVVTVEPIPLFTTDDITKFSFPQRVPAIMSDGTVRQLVVNWDTDIPKPSKGIYNFTGTILGYGNKVTMSVALDSGTLDQEKDIEVINEIGNKDKIVVKGQRAKLNQGDIVSVYKELGDKKPLKTANIDKNGNAIINGLNLNEDGGEIYVSITRKDKAEGSKITVPVPAEAPVGFSVEAQKQTVTKLKPNRKYKVYISDVNEDGSLPKIDGTTIPDADTTSDEKGTITVNNMKTKILGSKNKKQMLRVVAVGNKDSMPSAAVEISKAVIPDYVSIDLNLGRIVGTTAQMQYQYRDGEEWKDCQPGTTPISMTMSLQVIVRVKGSGPVMDSDTKTFGLFPMPVITGIENGKIYSIGESADGKSYFPDVTWSPSNKEAGVTCEATLTKDGGNVGTINDGTELKQKIKKEGNGNYEFTVTAKKEDINMNPSSATNSTTVKFTVNSAVPSKPEVTMVEKGGTKPAGVDPETYYQATPSWMDLAGTSSETVLQRVDKEDYKATKDKDGNLVDSTDWSKAAKVAFIRGNTINQDGYYKLTVTTTSRENGAKSSVAKVFKVDTISRAELPGIQATIAKYQNGVENGDYKGGINEGGIYKKIKEIELTDNSNCITTARIMREGYITPYITPTDGKEGTSHKGKELTVNGAYALMIKTVNVLNGHFVEKELNFAIDVDVADNSSPMVETVTLNNKSDSAEILVGDIIPYGSIIKVYDPQGRNIGSATNDGPAGQVTVKIPGGLSSNIDKIYVTRTDLGKEESNKKEISVTKVPSIKSVTPTTLTESEENNGELQLKDITIEIINGTFVDGIAKSNVSANNLPAGMNYTVVKLDDAHLRISITDGATNHESRDSVSNLTFTIAKEGINDSESNALGNDFAKGFTTQNIAIEFMDAEKAPILSGVSFSDGDGPALGGKTKIKLPEPSETGNTFAYKISADENAIPTPNVGEDAKTEGYIGIKSGEEISVNNGKHIAVVELKDGKIVKFIDTLAVAADDIKQIKDLSYGTITDTTVDLSFTAPKGATSVKVMISKDGVTWADAKTDVLLTEKSLSAKVIDLEADKTYIIKLVVTGGDYDGESNQIQITTAK